MCITIDGPKIWNSPEAILIEETSIHMFKHKYMYNKLYLPFIDMWYKVDVRIYLESNSNMW